MKSAWRLVVFWRYLLLACLVMVGTGGYLFVEMPHPTVPSALQPPLAVATHLPPSPLRDQYEKIDVGMKQAQVIEMLGPPRSVMEVDVMDTTMMAWAQGQDRIRIWFFSGDTEAMIAKQFIDGSEPSPGERHPIMPGK